MAKIERTYNVPLRKEYMSTSRYRRTKKASIALREFLVKHMKSENVKIGKYLNEFLWKNGIRNPPHHVKVIATKEDDGKVFAELADAPTSDVKVEKVKVKKAAGKESKEVKAAAKAGEKEIKEELKKVAEKTEKIKAEKKEKPAAKPAKK